VVRWFWPKFGLFFGVHVKTLGNIPALALAWDKEYRMLSLESDSTIAVSLVNKGCPSTHL
jgi:hypothetical protein